MCGVHLYSENGIEKPGWPVRPYYTDSSTNRFVGGCPSEGFAFGDLDGDGVPELVVIADGSVDNTLGLFAWHLGGTPAAGFPVAIPGTASRGQPVIGDIDGDGKPEIVFSAYVYCAIGPTNPAMLFAYHSDGTVVKGFPMDYSGLGDPGSLSTPILDDFNGDGKVDIITTPDRSSGWIYVTTLNGTYSRDTIEWPMDKFDVMRTGWYRKMAHVDRAASWLTASAAAIPGDGISSTWIIAHGIRPNSQPILLPDQFVRFGRLPDLNGGEFSTFQDNANGSWSQKLTAPNIEDPVTVTVSGWINEFKLNQTIPVTFWGKPRMNSINPRIFPTGWFTNSTITGANFGSGVTLRALSPDLRIANATRVSETGMTARFSVSGRALSGPRYFVANAYGRDSAPQWVLAYGPHDLFLMMDKTAGTTASWVGLASSNYKLLRDTAPSFPAPSTIYTGPAKSFADPASGSYFYLVIP